MGQSKYGAKKVTTDGIVFDSKSEEKYYRLLKHLKEIGEIEDFVLQPSYILQPSFQKNNKKYLAIKYVADFLIKYKDGTEIVVDVKGMATPNAILKRKMFDYTFRDKKLIWVCESIKYGDKYGWIEYDELKKKRKENKKK